MDPLRILAAPADKSGCGYYRMAGPLGSLQRLGHTVHHDRAADVRDYDIVVTQRPCNEETLEQIERLAAMPGRTWKHVAEIDDDLWGMEKHQGNPAYDYYTPERLKRLTRCLLISDLVTVSTPELAEVCLDLGCTNVQILPNFLDRKIFSLPITQSEGTVVTWGGSASHLDDFRMIGPTLDKWLGRNPETLFRWLRGPYQQALPHAVNQAYVPWTNVLGYYRALSGTVGIAPLRASRFTASKSPIKA